MEKLKLYCIPYSGGSADLYLKWKKEMDNNIQLVPVELAGRGKRMKQPFYVSWQEAVTDIVNQILEDLKDGERYAIYGHSMGALLAFETYYELLKRKSQMPIHMFFSGRKAPQNIQGKTAFYALPEEEFLKVVYVYGGSTPEAMANPVLRNLFLPILRADFRISETYEYELREEKIACPITLLNGKNDESVLEFDMNEWREFAGSSFCERKLEGSHFFIMEHIKEVTEILLEELLKDKC